VRDDGRIARPLLRQLAKGNVPPAEVRRVQDRAVELVDGPGYREPDADH
jgi:hypothetical protein